MAKQLNSYPTLSFNEALNTLVLDPMKLEDLDQLIAKLGSNVPAYFKHELQGGLELQQVPQELQEFSHALVHNFAGKEISYLEVGVGSCATLIFLSQLFKKHSIKAKIHAVDNLEYYQQGHLLEQKIRIEWCQKNLGLDFFNSDSADPKLQNWLSGKKFDTILVDGDHSFEGCLLDFSLCLPHLKKDGLLVLHDITSDACPGVGKVFEFTKQFFGESQVISHSRSCGIGILKNPLVETLPTSEVLRVCKREFIQARNSTRAVQPISLQEIVSQTSAKEFFKAWLKKKMRT